MATTPLRAVRVPPQLWDAAQARARSQNESVSTVIRRALEMYVDGSNLDPAQPLAPTPDSAAEQTPVDTASRPADRPRDNDALIAIGMIMERLGVDEATATRHLAAHSHLAAE